MQLVGKKAIVTGGAQSIGKAIAIALAQAGADVVIQYHADHSQADAQNTVSEITKLGRAAFAIQANFMQGDGPEVFMVAAMKALNGADILVSCAAGYEYASILDITSAALANIQKMNIEIPLRLIQTFSRDLIQRKVPGSIINISSFFSFKPEEGNALIACSKAGLNMLTKCAALELGFHQIRVNGIAPGRTQTPSNEALMQTKAWQKVIDITPLHRTAIPDDFGGLAVLLASDASSFITGTTILCDGGYTLT